MQSPTQYIVKPLGGGRYNNTKSIGGLDFIVNTSEEDHRFSNREAVVVAVPRHGISGIRVGHKLLVHHNVFKFYNDMQGQRRSGKSFLKGDLFLVDPDQFFMYHDGTRWRAVDRYCFVEPLPASDEGLSRMGKHEPLHGIMRYPNNSMLAEGVNAGDVVCFAPDSEYSFIVDGVEMYRVFDHQITVKLWT